MKKIIILSLLFLFTSNFANAGYVRGYYRKDGTYVSGHYRSNPDGQKWNNYGPSEGESSSPSSRDHDNDNVPNRYDRDDDNDLIDDDYDSSQYGEIDL